MSKVVCVEPYESEQSIMVCMLGSLKQPTFSVLRHNFAHFSQSLVIKHGFHEENVS